MSGSACGCEATSLAGAGPTESEEHTPWWRRTSVIIPVLSGVALVAGLALDWFVPGALPEPAAQVLFWVSLLLGASQFAPGALRGLVTRGRLGIGLLMTISAIGAVVLGFVEEAAALAFLYSIVEALEDIAMDRARTGLRSLLTLIPANATVVAPDGTTRTVPVSQLAAGDRFRLFAGERSATDGVVRAGRSSLDVSAITGESIPVEVGPGDEVLAGSINTSGVLEVEATPPGRTTR